MNTKKIMCVLLSIALLIGLFISFGSVRAEIAQEYKSPELKLVQIDSGDTYSSNFSQENLKQEGNKYTYKTNSAYAWYMADSIDFAYKEVQFNYKEEDEAVMMVELTLDSWSAYSKTGSFGIMIRTSLDPKAEMVLVHARPEAMLTVYRMQAGKGCGVSAYGPNPVYNNSIHLRLVLSENKVSTYYRFGNNAWNVSAKGIIFNWTEKVYVGFAGHTSDQTDMATAVCRDLNITVEANEGYSFEEGTSSDGAGEDDTPSEPEFTLPEDIQPTDDILLRETFTDGCVFDGEESNVNPIWQTTAEDMRLELNSDKTDRYFYAEYLDSGLYWAGNDNWTDYSTEMKITFPEDLIITRENQVTLFTRFNRNVMHGYHYYCVTLHNKNANDVNTQTITLGYVDMGRTIPTADYTVALVQKELNYLENLGTENTLKVETFDNNIKVYWNGECIIDFTDTLQTIGNVQRYDIISKGCVAIKTFDTCVSIDDIVVKKLNDYVGGDYDNKIKGNWNDPLPDYLETYSENKWYY